MTTIKLLDSDGKTITAEVLPPTIARKARYREIERSANQRAHSYNARLELFNELAKQRELARQSGDEALVADLDKQISAERTELDLLDELTFKDQIDQILTIVSIPNPDDVDFRNCDTREFDKAIFAFFGLGALTTSA